MKLAEKTFVLEVESFLIALCNQFAQFEKMKFNLHNLKNVFI